MIKYTRLKRILEHFLYELRRWFTRSENSDPIVLEGLVSPPKVNQRGQDWEQRGNYFRRTLVITDLPDLIDLFWFGQIQSRLHQNAISCTYHIKPYDHCGIQEDLVERTSHLLSHEVGLRRHGLREQFETKSIMGSTLELSEEGYNTSYFELSFYIELRASSKQELEILTDNVYNIAESEDFGVSTIRHRHVDSMNTTAPIGSDEINYSVIVNSHALSLITLPIYHTQPMLEEENGSD